MFILIVAGSQGFDDYPLLAGKLDIMLRNQTEIIIRQGECPNSPDTLAKRYAEARGFTLQSFPADWTQGRGAGWKRNWEMAKGNGQYPGKANGLAAFTAGTRGTANMIEIAEKCGIPVRIIQVVVDPTKLPKRNRKQPVDKGYNETLPPMHGIVAHGNTLIDINNILTAGKPRPRKGAIIVDGEELIPKTKSPRKKKPAPAGDSTWKIRYQQAHEANFAKEYPAAHKDGHYIDPIYPKVRESNGMQTAIVNYLNWMGHRAKRINNMGRLVDGVDVTESGAKITAKKWIPSAAGKGQSDVSSTLWGKSVQLEIKAGNDKPSDYQLKEQAKERRAGGIYEFMYSIEGFFALYDKLFTLYGSSVGLFE